MIETLISFAAATLALAASPGPDNIFVLTQSITNGTKSGIATTAGLISGCIVHTTFLAFGISALITSSAELFYLLKFLGAGYLIYLAIKVFKSSSTIQISQSEKKSSYWELYKIGVIMNLTNPKVLIFFIAFFPAFLWNVEEGVVLQFYVLGGVFMLISFLTFSTIAILAGLISENLNRTVNLHKFLKVIQIAVFVGIAVYILLPD